MSRRVATTAGVFLFALVIAALLSWSFVTLLTHMYLGAEYGLMRTFAGLTLLIPIGVATLAWFYTSPAAGPRSCPCCGYDLRGSSGGACPECGEATASTHSA